MGDVSGTVEVSETGLSGAEAPSAITLFLAYDPDKLAPIDDFYEVPLRNALGIPQLDGEDNPILTTQPVRLDAALDAISKTVDYEIFPQGVVGIALHGASGPLPDGPLMRLAFRVSSANTESDVITLTGINESNEVSLNGQSTYSSAADSQGAAIALTIANGRIVLNCTPAEVPRNISASTGRANGVQIQWDAVATAGAEYRVFRSSSSDVSHATTLGNDWQTEIGFLDVTADPPLTGASGGCTLFPQSTPVLYYYWVRARTPEIDCESDFNDFPAEGFRGRGKSTSSAALMAMPRADLPFGDFLAVLALSLLFITPYLSRSRNHNHGPPPGHE
jgi:hypothetical protein